MKDPDTRLNYPDALFMDDSCFRQLVESSPDSIFIYIDEKIIFANRSGLDLFGAENPGELIGRPIWEFVPEESHNNLRKAINKIINDQYRYISAEDRIVRLDGETIDIEISSTFFPFQGKPGIQAFLRDITRRKRAEERLRESENRYRTIFETTGTAMFFIEEDTTISLVNSECEKLSGLPRDQIEGIMSWMDFISDDDVSRLNNYHMLRRIDIQLVPSTYEFRMKYRDGSFRNVLMNIALIPGTKQSVASLTDLTDIKNARSALAESEEKYRLVVENTKEAIAIIQEERVRYVNPKICEITGYESRQLLGRKFFHLVHPDSRPIVVEEYRQRLSASEVHTAFPVKIIDTSNYIRWMEIYSVTIIWENRPAVLIFLNDITERKLAQEALQASEEKYRLLAENARDIIMILDLDGNISYMNRAGSSMIGLPSDEVRGMNISRIIRSGDYINIKALEKGSIRNPDRIYKNRMDILNRDGQIIQLETISNPVRIDNETKGVLVIARDVTERQRLEKEVIEISERIRRQVSRDLHDDLNPHLIGVEALAEVLKVELERRSIPQANEAAKISMLVNRAITKTHRLARGLCPVDLESAGLPSAITNLVKLIRSMYGIDCRFTFDDSINIHDSAIAANIYYIAQEAAFNAAKHSSASKIIISLRMESDILKLMVEDNGIGITRSQETCKENGNRGMGLDIMKYRAEIINGSFGIRKRKPAGTVIQASVALERES